MTEKTRYKSAPNRWQFCVFLALGGVVVIMLVVICAVVVPAAIQGISNPWDPGEWRTMLLVRSPYIAQSFANLALFLVICALGALLYSKRMRHARHALPFIAAAALASAILLHSMIYGIDILFPSTYSLLAPYHTPFMLIGNGGSTMFTNSYALSTACSIATHILAPQVLFGLLVSFIAVRRYVKHAPAGER